MTAFRTFAVLVFLTITTFAGAQSVFRQSQSEFFIQTPARSRYTVSLGDETISSTSGRFRFFDLRSGRVPVVIELNNRVVFRTDVYVKPGFRTIAVLNRNNISAVKELDLNRYNLDNWDRILNEDYTDIRPVPGRPYGDNNYSPVMSSDAFARFLKSIKDAAFYKDKLSVIDLSVGYSYFTVSQIRQVMKLMPFQDEKLAVISKMYPSVADPENVFQILDEFPFSDDKEKVKAIVMAGRTTRPRR